MNPTLEFLMAAQRNMAGERSNGKVSGASQSMNLWFAPPGAMTVGNPFLEAGLRYSAQASDALGTLTHAWLSFVSHRLEQNYALSQHLSQCRDANEMSAVHKEFWRQAAEDYAQGMGKMTKLMNGVTTKLAHAAQSATEEASQKVVARQKAA